MSRSVVGPLPGLARLLLFVCALLVSAPGAHAQTFPYQAILENGSGPVSGDLDFRFRLYNAPAGGAQYGSQCERTVTGVQNGLVSTLLDFGAVYPGLAISPGLWLEVDISPAGANTFDTLSPRQQIMPALAAEYAFYAETGPGVGPQEPLVSESGLSDDVTVTHTLTIEGDDYTDIRVMNDITFLGGIGSGSFPTDDVRIRRPFGDAGPRFGQYLPLIDPIALDIDVVLPDSKGGPLADTRYRFTDGIATDLALGSEPDGTPYEELTVRFDSFVRTSHSSPLAGFQRIPVPPGSGDAVRMVGEPSTGISLRLSIDADLSMVSNVTGYSADIVSGAGRDRETYTLYVSALGSEEYFMSLPTAGDGLTAQLVFWNSAGARVPIGGGGYLPSGFALVVYPDGTVAERYEAEVGTVAP